MVKIPKFYILRSIASIVIICDEIGHFVGICGKMTIFTIIRLLFYNVCVPLQRKKCDYMKITHLLLAASIATTCMQSCIGEEPLNAECDLLAISLSVENAQDILTNAGDTLKSVYDSDQNFTQNTDAVVIDLKPEKSIGFVPVSVVVTEGATVESLLQGKPVKFTNGDLLDFSNGKIQTLRITSQDRMWHRDYTVRFKENVDTMMRNGEHFDLHLDFEESHLEKSGKYYEWSITDPNAQGVFTDGMWKNGNPGYKLSKSSAKPMDYPSVPLEGQGPDGSNCVKLETRETGSFGAMVNMRMASGSMFNGIFDVANALKDALKATCFGSPFRHVPNRFSVWLKAEPGPTFQNKQGKPVAGVTDEPDAYAVFYRNRDENGDVVQLDGNNVLSSDRIVALARLPHHYNADGSDQLSNSPIHGITTEWQKVELKFHDKDGNEDWVRNVDWDLLQNYGYSLIIGFASSWQGAYFQGAIGSKLYLDDVLLESYPDDYVEKLANERK